MPRPAPPNGTMTSYPPHPMTKREGRRVSVLRLEGSFDLPAARLLEHSLRGLASGDRVRIDFSGVKRLHDYGIASLAQALAKVDGVDVKIEGLSTHHVRLLRYFGIGAEVFRREHRGDD